MSVGRVLVTGGAGFIGSRLARQLSMENAEVVVVDNLHPQVHGHSPRPVDIGNARLVRISITDPVLADLVSEFDPQFVYHLAAETGTGQSMEAIARYCDVNVTGTALLLEALIGKASSLRRFLLASSRAVYGEGCYLTPEQQVLVPGQRSVEQLRAGRFDITEGPNGESITPTATTESTPPSPVSVYASTKLTQEQLVSQVCSARGIPYSILRFQNVYGDGQSLTNPYTGVLSVFVTRLLNRQSINVFEDGQITRDFVYVDDVVDALALAAGREEADGVVINVGTGTPVTILEVACEIIRLVGTPDSELRISGDFRPGDVRFALGDVRRANAILGWAPRVSLGEGLEQLVTWARATS